MTFNAIVIECFATSQLCTYMCTHLASYIGKECGLVVIITFYLTNIYPSLMLCAAFSEMYTNMQIIIKYFLTSFIFKYVHQMYM